eukprot:snap_masked-scaffold_7-processed-gene-13.30-mRNA-1 protein AED:1.00 eAED:1.00 QI:0/-1/0/0/-1/1/1/0/111
MAVATYLTDILANKVWDVKGSSNMTLKLVVKPNGKRKVLFVDTYAPHTRNGAAAHKKYLDNLKKMISDFNKRRLIFTCGDFNTQVTTNELSTSGKIGFPSRSKDNAKLLVN